MSEEDRKPTARESLRVAQMASTSTAKRILRRLTPSAGMLATPQPETDETEEEDDAS